MCVVFGWSLQPASPQAGFHESGAAGTENEQKHAANASRPAEFAKIPVRVTFPCLAGIRADKPVVSPSHA